VPRSLKNVLSIWWVSFQRKPSFNKNCLVFVGMKIWSKDIKNKVFSVFFCSWMHKCRFEITIVYWLAQLGTILKVPSQASLCTFTRWCRITRAMYKRLLSAPRPQFLLRPRGISSVFESVRGARQCWLTSARCLLAAAPKDGTYLTGNGCRTPLRATPPSELVLKCQNWSERLKRLGPRRSAVPGPLRWGRNAGAGRMGPLRFGEKDRRSGSAAPHGWTRCEHFTGDKGARAAPLLVRGARFRWRTLSVLGLHFLPLVFHPVSTSHEDQRLKSAYVTLTEDWPFASLRFRSAGLTQSLIPLLGDSY